MRISDWSSDVCSSDLWWFVVGERYAAWIEKQFVAEGSKTQVFGYARKVPYLVVTGAKVRTTFTPDLPAVSDLQLDMGIRIPVLRDWPGNKPVNGQAAYTSHVVELPVRNDDGSLRIVPALLPRTADVSRSEEHTSELQSLMRISYAVFC